jgi:hypothetical protein
MKQNSNKIAILFFVMLFAGFTSMAQTKETNNSKTSNTSEMKTYVIEREMAGVGNLTPEQLKGASQNSNAVLKELGPKIQWIHSYVTGDKIFCIYKAENPEIILEHAKKAGFPANKITPIATTINPATGN